MEKCCRSQWPYGVLLVVDLDQGEDDRPAKFPHRPLERRLPQNEEKIMSPQSSSICHGALMATTLRMIPAMKTSLGMGLNEESPCARYRIVSRELLQSDHTRGHLISIVCTSILEHSFWFLSQAGRPYVAYLAHNSRSGEFTCMFPLRLLDNSIRCSTAENDVRNVCYELRESRNGTVSKSS
jgi:hypothetical protein